ncbi:MAG: hypothetical protein IJ390_13100, partial [Lachnospiraceae bacterium]|nr:hypothetical protein [Lachnospiraceae bacterium]
NGAERGCQKAAEPMRASAHGASNMSRQNFWRPVFVVCKAHNGAERGCQKAAEPMRASAHGASNMSRQNF